MENILDEYGIIPLVGVIPYCEDSMMKDYVVDSEFWERVKLWKTNNGELRYMVIIMYVLQKPVVLIQ